MYPEFLSSSGAIKEITRTEFAKRTTSKYMSFLSPFSQKVFIQTKKMYKKKGNNKTKTKNKYTLRGKRNNFSFI